MMKNKGFSLIELVLVVIVVAILAVLITSLPGAIQSIRKSGNTSTAREIVSKEMDTLRKQPYATLSNGSNSFTDSGLSTLPFSTATYEIEDCPIAICSLGEEAKTLKVEVDWIELGITRTVEFFTIITDGGLGQ